MIHTADYSYLTRMFQNVLYAYPISNYFSQLTYYTSLLVLHFSIAYNFKLFSILPVHAVLTELFLVITASNLTAEHDLILVSYQEHTHH